MTRSRPVVSFLRPILGLIAGALLLAGCGGGSSYTVRPGDLAQRFLPPVRSVAYHPDSLGAVSIEEKENRFQIKIESDYEVLHRKWSSSYRNLGTGPERRSRSYATFWSKELSLASLETEVGLSTLSRERAQDFLEKRRQEYKNSLQFEVYWFESEGNSLLAGPGSRVELKINNETYRPTRESHGPLREAFVPGSEGQSLYRRNTFYFARVHDDTDILRGATGMTLTINQTGGRSRIRFAWDWSKE